MLIVNTIVTNMIKILAKLFFMIIISFPPAKIRLVGFLIFNRVMFIF